MILDVDIGNTRIKWRILSPSDTLRGASLKEDFATLAAAIDEIKSAIRRIRVACVAGPETRHAFVRWCEEHLKLSPEFAKVMDRCNGFVHGYHQTEQLGVDRWLAMLGVYEIYPKACVIIDVGTAVTIDFVRDGGEHAGGLVLPGLEMSVNSLWHNTEAVKVESLNLPQIWAPGCNTLDGVRNGMAAMYRGLLQESVNAWCDECQIPVPVWVTGGGGLAMMPWCGGQWAPDLVLDGLAMALP